MAYYLSIMYAQQQGFLGNVSYIGFDACYVNYPEMVGYCDEGLGMYPCDMRDPYNFGTGFRTTHEVQMSTYCQDPILPVPLNWKPS